ncbi:NnrS family protein [Roseovarius sp. EL26]|uniref:NnrS family protein n=1 Tax=Roseovarius sp. EL26 TaxID=2126672 RepID=UPI000EA38935|nr:NnrS family protein [Roseovarius sp. EL26]
MTTPRLPILFNLGFRPFFLLATGFAVGAIALWMMIWHGLLVLQGPFSPTDWHIHEMLFAYSSAVIAGFLLTAIPNWTGGVPIKGWALAFLVILWVAGRIAVLGATGLSAGWIMAIDSSFLAVLCIVTAYQLIASHNWRNLIVIALIFLLLASNMAFHYEAVTFGTTDYSRRAGMAVLTLLIMLIGGRVIPSFTRNWLLKQKITPLPAPFDRFDATSLGIAAIALGLWVFKGPLMLTAIVLSIAAAAHLVRTLRWQGFRARRSAILLMLHVSYLCLPAGFALLALSLIRSDVSSAAGLHVLGMGAVGGMTTAVMLRASLGHTGRALAAGPTLSLAFTLVLIASLVRALVPNIALAGVSGVQISALLWMAGFTLICTRIWPWFLAPRVD